MIFEIVTRSKTRALFSLIGSAQAGLIFLFFFTIQMEWYEYNPDEVLFEKLAVPARILGGCSLLPYLAYNDYLAQNEDNKYFYRSKCEKGETWNSRTGRSNTLLTHMLVIAFIEEYLRFTEITDMFQRGMGVAPLPMKLLSDVTGGLVVY